MIVPDVNLLLYVHNQDAGRHAEARAWWQALLNGSETVGLAWLTMAGYIRLATSPRIFPRPLAAASACADVRAWLARPQVSVIDPGPRHGEIFFSLLERLGTAGNLTTDAHLAALAIEFQAELHSTDADMARFPGLRWRNPLVRKG